VITIRREKTVDPAAIRRVLDGAFGRSKESAAVDRLRQRGAVVLSLVALRAETIIGHVMFTAARLDAQAAPTWLDDEQRAPARPGRAEPRPPLRSPHVEPELPWLTLDEQFAREQREREMAEVAEAAEAAARAKARKELLEANRLAAITAGLTPAPPHVVLGPLGVLPNQQRRGIGTLLVQAGLDHLARVSCEAVFVLGDPRFYGRFGFVSARLHGIGCELPARSEAFQVRVLAAGSFADAGGVVRIEPELHI